METGVAQSHSGMSTRLTILTTARMVQGASENPDTPTPGMPPAAHVQASIAGECDRSNLSTVKPAVLQSACPSALAVLANGVRVLKLIQSCSG